MSQQVKRKIKEQISKDRIVESIDYLIKNTDLNEESINELVILRSEFRDLLRRERMGILSHGELRIKKNQTINMLLRLIDEFEINQIENLKSDHHNPSERYKVVFYLLGIMSLIFSLVSIFYDELPEKGITIATSFLIAVVASLFINSLMSKL